LARSAGMEVWLSHMIVILEKRRATHRLKDLSELLPALFDARPGEPSERRGCRRHGTPRSLGADEQIGLVG